MEMDDLAGKAILVLGGTAGIGGATALALARRGARVLVVGRSRERGSAFETLLRAKSADCSFFAGDICDEESFASVMHECVNRLDHLDVAVNNAAAETGTFQATADSDEAEFDETIRVNLKVFGWR